MAQPTTRLPRESSYSAQHPAKHSDYAVGDRIEYRPFGASCNRVLIVTGKDADIKNGQPGFDGHLPGLPEETFWGYDFQITYVVRAQVSHG